MGGLVGDVPPTKNYWKGVRKICTKYKVHLILDEVWCGTGTTGKIYCIDWDNITPDFIFMGNMQQMYVQVGNAVPYLLSKRIAESLKKRSAVRSTIGALGPMALGPWAHGPL